MDDLQLNMLDVLIAQHIIEIALSDSYVENLLLSRLRAIALTCDEETKAGIELVIESNS